MRHGLFSSPDKKLFLGVFSMRTGRNNTPDAQPRTHTSTFDPINENGFERQIIWCKDREDPRYTLEMAEV